MELSEVTMVDGTCDVTRTDKCGFLSSKAECDFIMMCHVGVAILSILSCIYIATVMIALRKWKNLTERLILYLTVAVFLHTFHYATDNYHNANNALNGEHIGFCIFQGIYQIFTAWLSNTWVLIIAFNISWIAKFSQRPGKHFEWISVFVNVFPALGISIIPLAVDAYGPAGIWCWISSQKDGQYYSTGVYLQFMVYYAPWVVLFFLITIALIVVDSTVSLRIKNSSSMGGTADNLRDLYRKEIKPLLPFPWIYIVCFVLPAACRLRIAAGYDDPGSTMTFVFWLLLAVFLPLPGLAFAVVITWNYRHEIKNMLYGSLKLSRPQSVLFDRPQPHYESTLTLQNLTAELWSIVDWYNFGILLGVPPSRLNKIRCDFTDTDGQRSAMLEWWLRNMPSSWHDIVKALRTSEENRLADTIMEKYLGVPGLMEPEQVTTRREETDIANQIKEFQEYFDFLTYNAQVEIRGLTLDRFRHSLTLLPCSIRQDHCEYLKENLPYINTAMNAAEVFSYLNFYWTFIDYSLLEHIIDRFGSGELKKKMRTYKLCLTEFSKITTVSQLLSDWTGRVEPPPYISEMIIKYDLKPTQCTLEQLEYFRKKFCCAFQLSTFAMMLACTRQGSISVTWHLPSSIVDKLFSEIQNYTGSVFIEHRVLTVQVDGKSAYDVFETFRRSLQQKKTEESQKMYFSKVGSANTTSSCTKQPLTYQPSILKLTWESGCAKLPVPMYDASAVVRGNAVYVGGGSTSRNGHNDTVFKYDLQNDEWNELPPCPVTNFGLAKLAGKLVAVGGILSSSGKISNKVFTFHKEQWKEQIPPMPTGRYSLTTVDFHSNLITCGGKCTNGVSDSVEIFKMGSHQWHIAHPLPSPCCNMSSAVIQDSCYLLGGYEDSYPGTGRVWYTPLMPLLEAAVPASTNSVPNTPHWCQLEQNIPSNRASAANLGDYLLAVGGVPAPGFTSLRPTPKINVYLQPTDSWCAFTDLPNSSAYFAPTVAELSNGELLIIGGATGDLLPQNTVYKGRLGRVLDVL